MGYAPKDGVEYTPFTTLEGVVAKETGQDPFDSPKALLDAVAQRLSVRGALVDRIHIRDLSPQALLLADFGHPTVVHAIDQVADASVLGQRRLAALGRTLAQLEQTPPRPVGADFSLDQSTVAVGLEYVRFRLPALLPADAYPRLHAWLEAARPQPSLHATRFE